MICYLLLFLCLVYLFVMLWLFFEFFKINNNNQTYENSELPFISILVAARNEENNIEHCLNSLLKNNYPSNKFEILVGNDDSTDKTGKIINDFVKQFENIKAFHFLPENKSNTKGKARVLSLLQQEAKGKIYLITDADIKVSENWIKNMVKSILEKECGLITGVTIIEGKSYFAGLQCLDWLYFMGILKIFSDYKKPITAVGNNMAVTAKAYNSVGGYEKIPFSITEDFALFDAIQKNGFKTFQNFNPQTVVFSQPVDDFKQLIKQRKRWLKGGSDLPFLNKLLIALYALWFPILICISIMGNPLTALGLFIIKITVQLFQILTLSYKLEFKKLNFWSVITYDVYQNAMIFATIYNLFSNKKTEWKGRQY